LHVNGLRNKFSEPDDVVVQAARSVQVPLFAHQAMPAVPVFSSAQTGLQAHDTYAALGNDDLIVTAGGGIFGHPQGVAAGVTALRDAWDAARHGQTLQEAAKDRPALRAALTFW
jgi:ribulose-bisphosphate carboxylase large chain